ncbi:hypothetical protein AURDEDRAFT_128029 [Auricularia subglabra TFB-10046 SS5]|nr:hypothetical protein AURDEDRAFT_128029 [Auricularia subglabra TFB-10046 SS5]
MAARTSDDQTQPLLTADRLNLLLRNAISTLISFHNGVQPVLNGDESELHNYATSFHHAQPQAPLTADHLKRLLTGTVSALVALNNALAPILGDEDIDEQDHPLPCQSQIAHAVAGQQQDVQTNAADGAHPLPPHSSRLADEQLNTSDERTPGFDMKEVRIMAAEKDASDGTKDMDTYEDVAIHGLEEPELATHTNDRIFTPQDSRSQRANDADHVMDETVPRAGAVQGSSLPYALLPPVDPPRHRNARHLAPTDVPFAAHSHPKVRRPVGVDRRDIAKNWNARQREELFKIGKEGAWMRSEKFALPAKLRQLLCFLQGLNRTVFAGQPPVTATSPLPTESGVVPDSLFLRGTERQIAFLTHEFTWSSPWVCVQIFPNEDLPCDFAGTFGGAQIGLEDHGKVHDAVAKALENSVPFQRFVLSEGAEPAAVIKTLRVEFVLMRQDGLDVRYWNVFLTLPVQTKLGLVNFRHVIAEIRPHYGLHQALVAFPNYFSCGTCGCATHPTGLCPTITTPGWMGFIPSPHNNRPAPGSAGKSSRRRGRAARAEAVNSAYAYATKKGTLSRQRRM